MRAGASPSIVYLSKALIHSIFCVNKGEVFEQLLALYVLWKQHNPPSISRLTLTAESSGDSKDQRKHVNKHLPFLNETIAFWIASLRHSLRAGSCFLHLLKSFAAKNRQQLTYLKFLNTKRIKTIIIAIYNYIIGDGYIICS